MTTDTTARVSGTIKALDDWVEAKKGKQKYLVSITVVGDYIIALRGDNLFCLSASYLSGWRRFNTLDAAKAAAQADYNARILAAIQPDPEPKPVAAGWSQCLEVARRVALDLADSFDETNSPDRARSCRFVAERFAALRALTGERG